MKLLVLLSRFPFPLDKGDKLRAFHQLRYLAQRHEICLFTLTDEDVSAEGRAAVKSFCRGGLVVHRLRRPGIARSMARAITEGKPLQVGYFYDARAQRKLSGLLHDFRPDHVYCQLIRMAEYLRAHAGQWPMTLDYMDVLSAGMARRATQAPRWQRPVVALEARRLLAYEAAAFDWFRHHTIISDQDRQLIRHPRRAEIDVVLNGIDTDYFAAQPAAAKEYDVLFCGNMSYHPNVDAACFLAEEIMPLVRARHPAARLLVAGTTPVPRVLALASAQVVVSGWVPDIRLEAMAMGLPCVTTPLAHNALGGADGQELRVADTGAALAQAISGLLGNPAEAAALAGRGQAFVKAHYTWAGATARLEALFG